MSSSDSENGSVVVSSRKYSWESFQVSSATCAWPGMNRIIACMPVDFSALASSTEVSMQMPDWLSITASGVSTRWNEFSEYAPQL